MKKGTVLFTLMILTAMLLAACGGGNDNNNQPTAAATTAATTAAQPTMAATEAATATVEATGTAEATPAGTATVEATPATGGGAGGGATQGAAFVRLSDLFSATVSTMGSGANNGIKGLLIEHPTPPPAAETGGDAAAATPTAEATPTVEATPTADANATPVATAQAGAGDQFIVRYVLVDTRGTEASKKGSTGQMVAVPWQALTFSSDGAVGVSAENAALAGAPHLSLMDLSLAGGSWADEVGTYWSGQNVQGMPAAGKVNNDNLALVVNNLRGITVADQDGNDLGPINDMIIDAATGQVTHLVVTVAGVTGTGTGTGTGTDAQATPAAGATPEATPTAGTGSTSGATTPTASAGSQYAIPMQFFTWTAADTRQFGSFTLNIPVSQLNGAPAFDASAPLDDAWNQSMQSFWSGVQGGGTQ